MDEFLDEQILAAVNQVKKKNERVDIHEGVYIDNELLTFKRCYFFDGKLSILLPESFVEMPQEMAEFKYPSSDRPQVIMSNVDTTVNFTFSYYTKPGSEFQVDFCQEVCSYMKMVTVKTNPTNKVIGEVSGSTTNTPISLFSYRGFAVDMPIFYITYVTIIDGYALFGGFNCPYREMKTWNELAQQAIVSIKDETVEEQPEESQNG